MCLFASSHLEKGMQDLRFGLLRASKASATSKGSDALSIWTTIRSSR